MTLAMPVNDVVIYDLVPGYKYRVRFTNNLEEGFKVEIEEDIEYNLKFNKNSTFTFNNFEKYLFGTSTIVDNMRSAFVNTYTLDVIIYNSNILNGTAAEGFGNGCYVVRIENESGKLNPEKYEQFCEEHNLPHLKPILKGLVPSASDAKTNLLSNSQISDTGRAYGLFITGMFDDVTKIIIADAEDFVGGPNSSEAERLLDEIVGMKATSQFLVEAVAGNTTLSNSTRVYNSIINKLLLDPEFASYKEQILEWASEKWLQDNLRPVVRRKFRQIYHSLKKNQGI